MSLKDVIVAIVCGVLAIAARVYLVPWYRNWLDGMSPWKSLLFLVGWILGMVGLAMVLKSSGL